MALAVYLAIQGDAAEIARTVAQVQAVAPRDPTDTRSPRVWLQDILTSVVEEYLRNAAAVAARMAIPAPLRLPTPPDPSTITEPDWVTVTDEDDRLKRFYDPSRTPRGGELADGPGAGMGTTGTA